MKLVRFSVGSGKARAGVVRGDKVVALSDLVADAPNGMRQVIAQWDKLGPAIAGDRAGPGPGDGADQ